MTCTNGGASANSSPVTITINPAITATASASPVGPFCGAAATTLTATGGLTYSWAPATGLSATTGDNVTCTATTTTTYTVTATGVGGCTGTANVTVTVIPNPVFSSVTATPATICVNGNSQLNASASQAIAANVLNFAASTGTLDPMTGATTVLTTGNDDSPGTLQPIGFSFAFDGVSHTQWSCTPDGFLKLGTPVASSQFTNSITSATNQPKIFPYWDDMATGTTGNVTSVVTGTAPNRILKIQWFVTIPRNTAGAANSTFQCWLYESTNAIEFRYGTMGAGAMSASVGVSGSGTNFQSVTLTGPTVSTVVANNLNAGQPALGTVYSFSAPALTYLWTPNTYLNFDNIANPLASAVAATTLYSVTATGLGGCTATSGVSVTTSAPITAATITGTLSFCAGASTTLTAVPTDGGGPFTYLWSPGGETTAAITVSAAGSYSCQVTDNCGGSVNTGSVTVVANPVPTASASSNQGCTGQTLNLTGTTDIGTGFSWSGPNTFASTDQNPSIGSLTAAAAGTYTFTASLNGCSSLPATVIVSVNNPPVITSTTATPGTICVGSTSQLQVNVAGPAAYCAATHTNGCSFGDEYIGNVTFVGINNSSTCAQSGPSQFTDYTAISTSVSAGTSAAVSFANPNFFTGDQGRVYIDWNQNGLFTDAGEETTLTGTTSFSGTVNVPAGAVNGNTRMRVRLFYTGATAPCGVASYGETEDYTLTVTGGAAAATFSWNNGGSLDNASIANPVATPATTTAYTVDVTANGCISQGTVSVTVDVTDTDGDGTADCADGCPLDPNKVAPGICGCGVSDVDTDGDGTADCLDGCPLDPNKVAPGICGCGVSDVDTDGDGTADCLDLCPLDPNKVAPGICGCGVSDVDTDGDGLADCIDNCPLVPGQIGDACDDGNGNTINDVLDANCVCAGIVPPCTDNLVFLDITTDNNGSQTSWEIIPQGGGAAVCSGGGLASNSAITATCCLPTGSYSLRVLDSFGDGMTSGPVGGYLLRDNNGSRIIDNAGDGVFTFVSQAPDFFYVPISSDRLTTATCDQESVAPSFVIQAQENLAVSGQLGVTSSTSGYQFWIFNPDGGYSRRITQTLASPGSSFPTGTLQALRPTFLRLNSLTTNPVPPFVLLNVRVRIQTAGVFGQFGSACRLKVDPPCGTTQLTTLGQPSNPAASCGATGVVINGGLLYADVISGANRYQFEFTRPGYSRLIAVNSRTLTLSNWATKPLLCGLAYSVRVRASFDNGATWCAFGSTCTITTESCPAIAGGDHRDLITVDGSDLTLWPNPNRNENLRLSINDLGASFETANVDITDMFGKRVMAQTIAVQGNTLNTVLELTDMAAGMYMVNVTVGEKTYMKRLMIQ